MEFFTKILGFLIFFLAITPCVDEGVAQSGKTTEVHQTYETHSADHSSAHDLCSPFCSCHCCHTHVRVASILSIIDSITFLGRLSPEKVTYPSWSSNILFRPPISRS